MSGESFHSGTVTMNVAKRFPCLAMLSIMPDTEDTLSIYLQRRPKKARWKRSHRALWLGVGLTMKRGREGRNGWNHRIRRRVGEGKVGRETRRNKTAFKAEVHRSCCSESSTSGLYIKSGSANAGDVSVAIRTDSRTDQQIRGHTFKPDLDRITVFQVEGVGGVVIADSLSIV